LVSDQELQTRKKEGSTMSIPTSQTPWQELYRRTVGDLEHGACIDFATDFLRVIERRGEPRHSH